MVPGTAPNSGQYSYHPALQQTQNIYIGMNQIMPQNNQLANELFNMSTNMSNLVQNQPKSHHASRRPAHTAGGPGSNAARTRPSGRQRPGRAPLPRATRPATGTRPRPLPLALGWPTP